MKCPRTGNNLKPIKVGKMEIDISEGCGGVWFDQHELNKFVSPSSMVGELLAEHMKEFHKPLIGSEKRLNCPRHTDVVMMRRFYSGKLQIEIDECPQCGGIWLDTEELDGIRELFPNHGDYESAQKYFVSKVMTSPEIQEHNKAHDELIEKLDNISNALWSIIGIKK